MRKPKDNEIAEFINKLSKMALGFHSHQSLRIRLKNVVYEFLEMIQEKETEDNSPVAEAIRENYYISWEDPWPGIDSEGEECFASIENKARASECIKMARVTFKENEKDFSELSDEELLRHFITVNWAQIDN